MKPGTLDLDSCITRHDATLRQEVAGSLMLYQMNEGRYFALDEVGARVWELCDGTRRLADVVAVLSAEYDAPSERIGRDVLDLVRNLADERLVVQAGAQA